MNWNEAHTVNQTDKENNVKIWNLIEFETNYSDYFHANNTPRARANTSASHSLICKIGIFYLRLNLLGFQEIDPWLSPVKRR